MSEDELLKREEELRAEEKLMNEAVKKLADVITLLVEAGYSKINDVVSFCPYCGSQHIGIERVEFAEGRMSSFYYCHSCRKRFGVVEEIVKK
jgi:transposase-like protein